MNDERKVIIIAGANGAGKTTFARELLPHEAECLVFVNADLIAAGLAPFAPSSVAIQAGRLMLGELDRHSAARHSFVLRLRFRAATTSSALSVGNVKVIASS